MNLRLGIFARTFARPRLEEVLDAVVEHGFRHVQFNLSCAGLPTLPDALDEATCQRLAAALSARGLEMSALSATFNLIHPDAASRHAGLRRLEGLARRAARLGTRVLTLCTGTRDAENMWRAHPENASPAAWNDLLRGLEVAIDIAGRNGVVLGVEPETANVIDSAERARALLDHFRSPHLKIVFDPANLFRPRSLDTMPATIRRALDLLGPDLVLAHAKDVCPPRAGEDFLRHGAAGTGVLDYPTFLSGLIRLGYAGPLILHDLREDQIPAAVDFLQRSWNAAVTAAKSLA